MALPMKSACHPGTRPSAYPWPSGNTCSLASNSSSRISAKKKEGIILPPWRLERGSTPRDAVPLSGRRERKGGVFLCRQCAGHEYKQGGNLAHYSCCFCPRIFG